MIRLSLIFLLLACTVACTPGVVVILYNNTGSVAEVYGCTDSVFLDIDNQKKINTCDAMSIRVEGVSRLYGDFSPLPSSHSQFEQFLSYGIGRIYLHAQLNSDGHIYLVKGTSKLPAYDFLGQPAGFPLLGILKGH